MAAFSRKRRIQTKVNETTIRFETLEPRNMLAADFGIADPYASSLLTHITNDVPVIQQMDLLRSHLNAQTNDTFELIYHNQDQIGFEHFKYQHLHNGMPVESSTYTVHAKDGLIVSLSGEYHELTDASAQPSISEARALKSALNHINANTYVWQDTAFQDSLGLHAHDDQTIHLGDGQSHDLGISFELPEADLVYAQGSLTYRFDIYAVDPLYRSWIFVDAQNGQIVNELTQIHDFNFPATGPTLYDANQVFTADFNGAQYTLQEAFDPGPPAGGWIHTYDLNGSTNYGNAVDFVSATANFGDPDHEVGNQTHYGTEQTWMYYFNNHGRDSWNGAGAELVSYVSYGTNYVNAFWNGSFMTYGDGNGVNRGPLVSLDIVGHEITHGVVQATASLDYVDQSGALNESFADIFGESVENYARGVNDWLMGGDIGINGNVGQFRSMANPNQFNDPDTYLGDYWYSGNGDNGGVHTNSGVQNKWFYIMVNGEAGTNDTGHTYNVTGVGMDDAAAIAYRNLANYLTDNSTYPDARVGAVQAAIDLFGVGSQQHLSTMAAWDAVGVYSLSEEFTLYPIAPLGSQIYAGAAINEVQFPSDTQDFELQLDANQMITLTVANLTGDLLPHVTITNSSGLVIADFVAATTADTVIIENLPAPDAGMYTINVAGDLGTFGQFEAKLWLNSGLEHEELGLIVNNDSLTNAENIDLTSITQGHMPTSIVDRLAVLGDLTGSGSMVDGEDFETGFLDGAWEVFSSTTNGRVGVADDTGTPNGLYALAMDVDTAGIFNLNEAILTVDMTDVTHANLSFSHVSFGDETHFLPSVFAGHFNGDGVAISDDGTTWYTVWTGITTPNGLWQDAELDLVQAAEDADLTLDSTFKIKFQQYDNFPRTSDGRAFDNISVGLGELEDWYSFTLDAGETATVVLNQTLGTPAAATIELYDLTESLLATGTVGGGDIRSFVENFANPAGVTETFYVRAVGAVDQYSLMVIRNGTFDLELATNQNITGLEGVPGFVSESIKISAEPDDAVDGQVVDTYFPDVVLSNEFTGGNIFAVHTQNYDAPTGFLVFSHAATNDSGFREGVNEFRADFTDLQSYVSIDVGSDDTLDIAFLRAYDSAGTLLQEVIGAGAPHSGSERLIIERPTADISYIVAAGVDTHTAPLDNLVFENQVIDADIYEIDALIGDDIEYRTYLPGGGPFEWVNRLSQPGGKEIQLTLFDPNGSPVAADSHVVSHQAELDGVYELRVTANRFDGEYFVSTDTGIVDVSAFGVKFLDGVPSSGTLADVTVSDDVRWAIDPSPTANPVKQKIEMILLGESNVFSPTSFGFRLEASMTGGPVGDVIQVVELWNEVGNMWETVDVRSIDNAEFSLDFNTSGNLDRFVHPLTREITARLTFSTPAFSGAPFNWSLDVDQAIWRVGDY